MRRRYENDIKLYEYVINSNCIGGTIFVDGKNVGVVSSSPLIYVTPKPIISSIEIKEETDEGTPGSPTYKALYKDDSKWNLGVVDSNVNIEGRFNNTVSLNTVSIIHIQSNIQDDSYIVFKADVNLHLIDPSDRYNPVYNNTITKQLRYEFK